MLVVKFQMPHCVIAQPIIIRVVGQEWIADEPELGTVMIILQVASGLLLPQNVIFDEIERVILKRVGVEQILVLHLLNIDLVLVADLFEELQFFVVDLLVVGFVTQIDGDFILIHVDVPFDVQSFVVEKAFQIIFSGGKSLQAGGDKRENHV